MTLDDYNDFCASLPFATHVVQWGGAHVWKVGGKVFAIAGRGGGEELAVTFKCSEMAFDILKEQPGLRPAPYLASRGMKWIQRQTGESMDDEALKDYLRESHGMIFRALPSAREKRAWRGGMMIVCILAEMQPRAAVARSFSCPVHIGTSRLKRHWPAGRFRSVGAEKEIWG